MNPQSPRHHLPQCHVTIMSRTRASDFVFLVKPAGFPFLLQLFEGLSIAILYALAMKNAIGRDRAKGVVRRHIDRRTVVLHMKDVSGHSHVGQLADNNVWIAFEDFRVCARRRL